jgi:hypothetical protein
MIARTLTTSDWTDDVKSEMSDQVRELTERYPLYPFLGAKTPTAA